MKVGILGDGFIEWSGGLEFLRMTASSLITADPTIELHFLFPISGPLYSLKRSLLEGKRLICIILGKPCKVAKKHNTKFLIDFAMSISHTAHVHFIDLGMRSLRRFSKKNNLDILLPAIKPLQNQAVPWIGYLDDYQYAYFPKYFSPQQITIRDRHFKAMLEEASYVIVNSQSVANDVDRFNPGHNAKVLVLPFSAAPNPDWLRQDLIYPSKYGISAPYFMICNQFWQHKDHLTAWKAFSRVLIEYPRLELICTGDTSDFRNPGYFDFLMDAARELGIINNLKILGLIPKLDQISLLKKSIALLQPTLFEGGPGGFAVFDAVSLGVPSIISNIKVNTEIRESSVSFFQAGNYESLAKEMIAVIDASKSKVAIPASELIKMGHQRRFRCGVAIKKIITELA